MCAKIQAKLAEFLEQNRAEAKQMSIYEYDEEKHMRQEREDAWADGEEAGRREGREEGLKIGRQAGLWTAVQKLLEKGMTITEVAGLLEMEESALQELIEEMSAK